MHPFSFMFSEACEKNRQSKVIFMLKIIICGRQHIVSRVVYVVLMSSATRPVYRYKGAYSLYCAKLSRPILQYDAITYPSHSQFLTFTSFIFFSFCDFLPASQLQLLYELHGIILKRQLFVNNGYSDK